MAPAVSTPRINFAFQLMMVSLLAQLRDCCRGSGGPCCAHEYIPSCNRLQQEVLAGGIGPKSAPSGQRRAADSLKENRLPRKATGYLASFAFRSAARLIWNSGSIVSARCNAFS